MNEQQYEPCALDEATHARTASNEIYEMRETLSGIPFTDIGDQCTVYWYLFSSLGITPVRKKEVNPVEFVGVVEEMAGFSGCGFAVLRFPAQCIGKTFRCVEVQP